MRKLAGIIAIGALGLAGLVVVNPGTAQAADPQITIGSDGKSAPVFDYTQAIRERVYIPQPGVDTDSNGEMDFVTADIIRPKESGPAMKVPAIIDPSPYYTTVCRGNESQCMADWDDDGVNDRWPLFYDNYFVPRGYAYVLGQMLGTGYTDEGCPNHGGPDDIAGEKSIVDWLNGRVQAYSQPDTSSAPVVADWHNGNSAMIGKSYDGTLANGVAATGVEGLKTIIPVSAISNWYEYYRANGLVRAPGTFQGEDLDILAQFTAGEARATGTCEDEIADITQKQDRNTGDYSPFWRQRDYLPDVGRVKASVFVVHGLNDWNVMTNNFAAWWDKLAQAGVTRKIWLHQGGHGGPGNNATYTLPSGQSWTYRQTENRWFDHELMGIDNGIMGEPRAIVQRENRSYTTYSDWPDPGAQPVRLRFTSSDATSPGGLVIGDAQPRTQQSFVDEGRTIGPAQLVASPDTANPNRLVYRSPELGQSVRLSGRPSVRLRMAIENRNDANLTAYLVDYDAAGSSTAPFVVTRGWMDPQNRTGWDHTVAVPQGQMNSYDWTFEPKDYIFPAGHRIGVVIFSSDQEYTLLPRGGTELTVSPGQSSVLLPIVGGEGAFDW